jgi:GT2 family glycosyltransferase
MAERPPIDFIIPFHGKSECLFKCIESIVKTTFNLNYKVIVVDDGSPDRNILEVCKRSNKRIIGVRTEENMGFGHAVNAGIKASSNPHIIIMHSDCEIRGLGTVREIQNSLIGLKSEGVKLVSARTNSVGSTSEYDPRILDDKVEGDFILDIPSPLIFSCMHRELFQRIGGGLKEYPLAWGEDTELYYRMKYYGYRQAVSAKSYVHHLGCETIKEFYKDVRSRKLMESNHQTLCLDVSKFLGR